MFLDVKGLFCPISINFLSIYVVTIFGTADTSTRMRERTLQRHANCDRARMGSPFSSTSSKVWEETKEKIANALLAKQHPGKQLGAFLVLVYSCFIPLLSFYDSTVRSPRVSGENWRLGEVVSLVCASMNMRCSP